MTSEETDLGRTPRKVWVKLAWDIVFDKPKSPNFTL